MICQNFPMSFFVAVTDKHSLSVCPPNSPRAKDVKLSVASERF